MIRARIRIVSLLALVVVAAGWPARAEVLLYRGEFVYLVPDALASRMLELASEEAWRIFPRHTRRIDLDGDGEHDFIAIGLGRRAVTASRSAIGCAVTPKPRDSGGGTGGC